MLSVLYIVIELIWCQTESQIANLLLDRSVVLQLNLTITDFRRLTRDHIFASVIGGILLMVGPLERGLTVFHTCVIVIQVKKKATQINQEVMAGREKRARKSSCYTRI